jgi:HJR/Mrr/RecB family endonuclease
MRLVLIILLYLISATEHQVCEYFYKDDLTKWWELMINFYASEFLLFSIISLMKRKSKIENILLANILVYLIWHFIDTVYFDIKSVTKEDIALIVVNSIVSIILTCIHLKQTYELRRRQK